MTGSQSWHHLTLEEIARGGLFTDGDWVESKDQDSSGGVRLTQLADVGDGFFRDRSNRWLREDQASRLNCTFLMPDDILIARMPDPLGRACLAPANAGRAVTVVDVAVLRVARDDVDARYVMWAINSPEFRQRVAALQSGTTRKRISRRKLALLTLPIPTIDEQRRIVDILEDHLSRLDAADSDLCEGMAKTERLDLAGMVQSIRPAVAAADAIRSLAFGSTCLEVPENWSTSTLGELAVLVEYGTGQKTGPPLQADAVPVLRMGNVKSGRLDWRSLKYLPATHGDLPRLLLRPGDLLFNRTNSAELVGKSAVFHGEHGVATFASYLIRARFGPAVNPEWASMVINSPYGRAYVASVVSQQVGQANVNGTKLKAFPMPVPPRRTQDDLVDLHLRLGDDARRLRSSITSARNRSTTLRRSMLAAAFSGRLTGAPSAAKAIEELAGV